MLHFKDTQLLDRCLPEESYTFTLTKKDDTEDDQIIHDQRFFQNIENLAQTLTELPFNSQTIPGNWFVSDEDLLSSEDCQFCEFFPVSDDSDLAQVKANFQIMHFEILNPEEALDEKEPAYF